VTSDEHASTSAEGESATSSAGPEEPRTVTSDLRDLLRTFAQPVIESLDARLRTQVDERVDERVETQLDERLDEALAARLAVIERAIADLDRQVRELRTRLGEP
jgi:hypothetical protein